MRNINILSRGPNHVSASNLSVYEEVESLTRVNIEAVYAKTKKRKPIRINVKNRLSLPNKFK